MDKELLYYVLASDVYLGQVISSGFKDIYLDIANSKFSPIRKLFELSVDYYLRYRGVITSDKLSKVLDHTTLVAEEKKALFLLFEEIKLVTPSQDLEFLLEHLKTEYANMVLKQKLSAGSELLTRNDVPNAINKIKEAIYATENVMNETGVSGDLRDSAQERANRYKDIRDKKVFVGLTTGFPTVDRLSGGMKPGELIVFMAGPKEGKSTALINVGHHLHMEKHKNVLHVSLENTKSQFERRYDSRCSGLSYTHLRDGTLPPDQEPIYRASLQAQRENPALFYVWDQPICSPRGIAAKITELSSKYTFDIVIVDYLGLLAPDKPRKERGWQEMSDITLDLRALARSFKIPILTAAQIGRLGSKSKKNYYDQTDIALSYAIIYNADTVVSFKTINPEMLKTGTGVCELNANLVKCRDGSEGIFIMDANFDRMKLQERPII